jgi:uncharacterized protein (DUF1684 family)
LKIRDLPRRCGVWMLVLGVSIYLGAAGSKTPDAFREEIQAWRADRVRSLTAEDGWLTLIGLFWLEEGENRLGSGPDCPLRLPANKAPARVGSLLLDQGQLRAELEPNVEVSSAGQPVSSIVLHSDADGQPTVLQLGDLSFFVIRRGDRFALRVRDRAHPARLDFAGIETYPADPAWRIAARFEPYRPPKPIAVPTVLGTIDEQESPGAAVFEVAGRVLRLDALGGDDGRLFLIFADETNGRKTYGGGRFLYAEPPSADGGVVLDFNRAYNPPCAFTDFATCPLPPRQNRLPIAVEAGERTFHRPH